MSSENENRKFDITRREEGVSFKHYQLMIKVLRNDKTEHHNLEIFTSGSQQLLEMRRIYAIVSMNTDYRTIYNIAKNN